MKKLITILAVACAAAIPSLVHAQGTVNFGSTAAAHQILVQQLVGPNLPATAGQVTVAIFGGALGTAEGSLVQLGATTLTLANGFIAGGTRIAVNTPEGTTGTFQIRAWLSTSTYAEASAAGLVGTSAVFNNATGAPNGSPATTPAFLTGWTSPVLVPVPEPSTIALGILGAGSLLFLRRKK